MTPRQELKDFDIGPVFDDDDSHADMHAEQWYSDAAAFMSEATKADAVGKGTDKRLKRLSGFDYCAALDNMHMVQHGRGLVLFKDDKIEGNHVVVPTWPPTNEPQPAPFLGMNQDECNKVLSPVSYFVYERGIRMCNMGDPNHAVQGNVWGAARDTGMWKVIKLTQISLNACTGPFASHGHLSKCIAAIQVYAQYATTSCPLLLEVLPDIASDMGFCKSRATDPAFAEHVLDLIKGGDFTTHENMKTVLTQWGSWFDSWGQRRGKACMHRLMKLFLAVTLGWKISSFVGKSLVMPEIAKDGEQQLSMQAQAK